MKILLSVSLLLGLYFMGGVSHTVFAAAPAGNGVSSVCQQVPGAGTSTFCQDQTGANRISGPTGVIVTGANILSIVAGIAAVVIITIGGLQYILSAGDSAKINTAKNMILYASLGLIIIALAQTIIRFTLSKL